MKILIPLLLLTLGVNANEVVYGSKSGTIEAAENEFVVEAKIIDVAAGEAIFKSKRKNDIIIPSFSYLHLKRRM